MRGWLTWTLVALVSWGIWAMLSKMLGVALSAEQSQALSTLGFVPILIPLAWRCRSLFGGASRRGLALALLGGIVSCLGNIPYYAAVARGEKFATVVSLAALAPLVTVLLALVILRERLNAKQAAGIALAMIAIWLFNVTDGTVLLSSAIWVALSPIVLWGLAGFLQKAATKHVTDELAALVFLSAFLPMGLFYGIREPWPEEIGTRAWVVVIGLGFFLALGNYMVIAACARGGKASVVFPVVNLFPAVSIGLVVLFLNETVGKREVAGILCALIAVALISIETPARAAST
jgi:drug/metabolite transporter (DMT)-like permease